jgi:hypothetical protein
MAGTVNGFQTPEEKCLSGIMNMSAKELEAISPGEILGKFLDSEREYLRLVLRPVMTFIGMLRVRKLVKPEAIDDMFLNVESIAELHEQLLSELETAVTGNEIAKEAGVILAKTAPYLKIYTKFSELQEDALKAYEKVFKDNSKFRKLVKEVYIATGVRPGEVMKYPTIRLPQYFVYMEMYADKLKSGTEEKRLADYAVQQIKEALDAIRIQLRDKFSRDAVVAIQMKVCSNAIAIVDPSRYLLKKGALELDGSKAYAALFNDMLLVLNQYGKPCQILRLRALEVDSSADTTFTVHDVRKKQLLVFNCSSESSAKSWVNELEWAIREDTETLIGSHICDDYFEKMILKKKPLVPLIRPDALKGSDFNIRTISRPELQLNSHQNLNRLLETTRNNSSHSISSTSHSHGSNSPKSSIASSETTEFKSHYESEIQEPVPVVYEYDYEENQYGSPGQEPEEEKPVEMVEEVPKKKVKVAPPIPSKSKLVPPPIRGPKPVLRQTLVALMTATRQGATLEEIQERNRLENITTESDFEIVPDEEIDALMKSQVFGAKRQAVDQ